MGSSWKRSGRAPESLLAAGWRHRGGDGGGGVPQPTGSDLLMHPGGRLKDTQKYFTEEPCQVPGPA